MRPKWRWTLTSLGLLALALAALSQSAGAHSAAGNRSRARAEAIQLLGKLKLPAGATPSATEPAGDGGNLSQPGVDTSTPNLVDAHHFWTVPEPAATVLAYVVAHLPAGAKPFGSTGANAAGGSASDSFSLPAVPGVLGDRWLAVSVVQLAGGVTAVRTDGETIWITPRPAREKIPAGVRSVTVSAEQATNRDREGRWSKPTTLSPSKSRRLVAFINRLEVVQPGATSCPAIMATYVRLRFINAGGVTVAKAVESPTGCAFVSLTIGRRIGPELNDYPSVTGELERLGALPK